MGKWSEIICMCIEKRIMTGIIFNYCNAIDYNKKINVIRAILISNNYLK